MTKYTLELSETELQVLKASLIYGWMTDSKLTDVESVKRAKYQQLLLGKCAALEVNAEEGK